MYRIPLLLGILVIQLLLVLLISLSAGGGDQARPFLSLDADAVTGLAITDGEGVTVDLTRTAEGWQLPGGLPADAASRPLCLA